MGFLNVFEAQKTIDMKVLIYKGYRRQDLVEFRIELRVRAYAVITVACCLLVI